MCLCILIDTCSTYLSTHICLYEYTWANILLEAIKSSEPCKILPLKRQYISLRYTQRVLEKNNDFQKYISKYSLFYVHEYLARLS